MLNAQGVWPRYKIDKITGHKGKPEVQQSTFPRVARIGEDTAPPQVGGKTLVIEGRTKARTLDELRTAQHALDAAFFDLWNTGQMVVTPTPPYDFGQWACDARILQLDQDDEQTRGPNATTPWEREFILGLRLPDARFYSHPDAVTTPVNTDPAADGGDTLTLHNYGSAPADPYFDIYGPFAGDVQVVRGIPFFKQLFFRGLDIPSGHTFRVDFRDQTAKDITADIDYTGRMDMMATDNWWDEGEYGLLPMIDTSVGVVVTDAASAPVAVTWRVGHRHWSW